MAPSPSFPFISYLSSPYSLRFENKALICNSLVTKRVSTMTSSIWPDSFSSPCLSILPRRKVPLMMPPLPEEGQSKSTSPNSLWPSIEPLSQTDKFSFVPYTHASFPISNSSMNPGVTDPLTIFDFLSFVLSSPAHRILTNGSQPPVIRLLVSCALKILSRKRPSLSVASFDVIFSCGEAAEALLISSSVLCAFASTCKEMERSLS
mmetsp:Transcript_32676/g.64012  ORF Transcript_32676/g.64012 Transcript_32676/m.64012 type:complete len:206 (-) Transcript_32676:568-1185(-)